MKDRISTMKPWQWIAIMVVVIFIIAAIFSDTEESHETEPSETTIIEVVETTAPETTVALETEEPDIEVSSTVLERDEAEEFIEYASDLIALNGTGYQHYIVGQKLVGSYLIVEAQLNRADSEEAANLCGHIISNAYSYPEEISWDTIDIQPLDGGVAARCKINQYVMDKAND